MDDDNYTGIICSPQVMGSLPENSEDQIIPIDVFAAIASLSKSVKNIRFSDNMKTVYIHWKKSLSVVGIERVLPQLEWTTIPDDKIKVFSKRIHRTLWLCFDVKQCDDASNIVSSDTFDLPYRVSVIKLREGRSQAGIFKEVKNSSTLRVPIGVSCLSAVRKNIEKKLLAAGQEMPKEGILADCAVSKQQNRRIAKKRALREEKENIPPKKIRV